MLCSNRALASPFITYAERGNKSSSWVVVRRCLVAAASEGGRYGRKRIRHDDNNDTPAINSYCGASRCQPIGVPGRYSLISTIPNSPASTPASSARRIRRGDRNSGIGGEG